MQLKHVPEAPKEEENPVALPARLFWVQRAFCALSRTRLVNEAGPQPITFADLNGYCHLTDVFDEEDRRDLIFLITELDIIWLRHTHAKIEKAREDAKKKAEREAERRRNRR